MGSKVLAGDRLRRLDWRCTWVGSQCWMVGVSQRRILSRCLVLVWLDSSMPFGTDQVILPPWDLLPTHETGPYLGKDSQQ